MSLDSLTGLINNLLSEPQAGLLNGMLFGVKATLNPQLKNSLIASGTLYILAHSGMTISVLVGMTDFVLLRFVRRPIANLISVAIIIGFVWLVGVSASVVRAAIMGVISLAAISFGRKNWPFLAWILAVTIMLLLNPLWIGDPSFQISVMATLGIILFGNTRSAGKAVPQNGRLRSFIRLCWSLVADDIRLSLAAQVFTVPIIMIQFHRISLVSPLSNILIGWLMAPIMALGFSLVIAGLIWMPLGSLFAWFVWVPLTYVIMVIEWTAKLPFASVSF